MRLRARQLATFISLALYFFFFGIFQVFYAKKPHITFTIRKTHLYRKEKTQLRDK